MRRITHAAVLAITCLLPGAQAGETSRSSLHAVEAAEGSTDLLDCESIQNPEGVSIEGLEQTFRRWAEALAAADPEAVGDLLTEDVEFWSHGREPLVGQGAAVDAFRPIFESYTFEQRFLCDEIILTPQWAFVRGTEVNRLTPREPRGEAIEIDQRAFSLLRRTDSGEWRFARGMTNRDAGDD